jgi:flavodoxin
MKKLIVYFSRVGENSVNGRIEVIEKGYTEILAEKIAKMTDAELWKLEPEEAYPFNYEECVKRANSEGWVKYLNKKDNLDEYDVIFLGFPNWWRTYPRIIATFIKDHNFFGKTVIPFCTNEEGAMGFAESELKSTAKGAIIKTGFACRGYEADKADKALKEWLDKVL